MLIKKTVVLTSDVTVGYITLVRVGNSVGMKVMLNSDPQGKLYLGLRAGSKPQINSEITDRRTEMNVDLDLGAMDELGAVLIDGSGSVYATGGKKEAVNTDKILKVRDAEKENPYAATSADAASDTEDERFAVCIPGFELAIERLDRLEGFDLLARPDNQMFVTADQTAVTAGYNRIGNHYDSMSPGQKIMQIILPAAHHDTADDRIAAFKFKYATHDSNKRYCTVNVCRSGPRPGTTQQI